MTFTSCQTDRQIRNLAQTSPYCPARELLSACHRLIKNTRGGMKGSHCMLFGVVPQLLSLTGYQRAFGRTAQPFHSLGNRIAVLPFDDKNQFTLHGKGRKRKRTSCGVPSLLHTLFSFLTYTFVAPVNVIVLGEIDVALGFFCQEC